MGSGTFSTMIHQAEKQDSFFVPFYPRDKNTNLLLGKSKIQSTNFPGVGPIYGVSFN